LQEWDPEQHSDSHWGLLGDLHACLVRQLEGPEVGPVAGRVLMAASEVEFETCVIWGFQSFREYVDEAGGGVASADLAGGTLRVSLSPLAAAAEVLMMDVEGKVTVVVLLSTRKECSTLIVAFG
jgi:hypothetical protein